MADVARALLGQAWRSVTWREGASGALSSRFARVRVRAAHRDQPRDEEESVLAKIRKALSKLATASPRYQCQECGFSSQRLLWQCPSCRDWETQRPASRVQFDTVLQHSITN